MTGVLFAILALGALAVGCAGSAPLAPKAVALNEAAAAALERGDLETAHARLALALEYHPRFVEALTNLGLVEMQRGNFEAARRLLVRARRLNPDIAQPHHGLGVLAEREHRRREAAEHYRQALAVDPGFAPARANLGRALFDAGMVEHAREQFLRLVEVAPEVAAGWSGLAEALIRLGRVEEADDVIERGLERFPADRALNVLGARSMLRRGDTHRAVEVLTPLSDANTDDAASAATWLATAHLSAGRNEAAARAAHHAVSLVPDDPVAVHVLAQALAALGHPDAEKWLARSSLLRREGARPGGITAASAE